jgi:hypothetical protein
MGFYGLERSWTASCTSVFSPSSQHGAFRVHFRLLPRAFSPWTALGARLQAAVGVLVAYMPTAWTALLACYLLEASSFDQFIILKAGTSSQTLLASEAWSYRVGCQQHGATVGYACLVC